MPQIVRIVIYCDLVHISKWLLCPFGKNPFEIDKVRYRLNIVKLRSGYKFYERGMLPPIVDYIFF